MAKVRVMIWINSNPNKAADKEVDCYSVANGVTRARRMVRESIPKAKTAFVEFYEDGQLVRIDEYGIFHNAQGEFGDWSSLKA